MEIPFVDLKTQRESIKNEIDSAMQNVIKDTAFIGGKYVNQFEQDFSQFIGIKNCISCANGTDALQITLKALGIGEGNEVIVPANSFISTSESVTAVGAKVVFCDVDESTNNLNVELIEEKITSRTKAIIAVHLYGRPADMHPILKIAEKHSLYVIEDAAQAHGAKYKNIMVGTLGDASCFSFYPGKNLGAYGDAGAMLTNNDALARKMRMWANHGRIEKYNHEFEAYNSRLDGLQAAILSVKLKHLQDWNEKRKKVAQKYISNLAGIDGIILPTESNDFDSVYHLFVIRTELRDKLQSFLKEKGVRTGIHYPIGLPFLKAYRYLNHSKKDFPVTAKNQSRILSLPIYAEINSDQIEYVTSQIKYFLSK